MNQSDKVKAIKYIRPDAEFVIRENKLEWLDTKQNKPSDEEIATGWIAYQAKLETDKAEAEAKKEAAQAKLAALGLTPDDLKALGLN